MAAFGTEDVESEILQLLREILAEVRRGNKLLGDIRDLEASRPH